MSLRHERQRIGAFDFVQDFANRLHEVAAINFLKQMRDDFRISLGTKFVTASQKFFLNRQIVFDNAVVNDDEISRAVRVRMGVAVGGSPMRRPARVTNPDRAFRQIISELVLERVEPSDRLFYKNFIAAINRNARRVVAAIFQLRQPVQKNRSRFLTANVSNYAAHIFSS